MRNPPAHRFPEPCQPLTLASQPRRRRRSRAASFRRGLLWTGALITLLLAGVSPSLAQGIPKEKMQSLDEQVQEMKSDVLGISAELANLEEKLLYPSNTQVAVFVSFAEGETLELDSVHIRIDGEYVAHHIYSFKELEALKKGGVQRIYTGNIATGAHQLEVSVSGKSSTGDFSKTEDFQFSKDVKPKLVGVTLAGGALGAPSIQLGNW